jgi:signal transduction histidine kinase
VTTANDDVPSDVRQLATLLLDHVERTATRAVIRMQELLPAYSRIPVDELVPFVLANQRNMLLAVLHPDADQSQNQALIRMAGETRALQGITSDVMLNAWRIGLEAVREEAHARADELAIRKDALLEFVVATLQWGDSAMRTSASAHHETEIRELGRLAEEQAALRRVATLVARGARPDDVFTAVAEKVAGLLGVTNATIGRFEPDGTVTTVAAWNAGEVAVLTGRRWDLKEDNVAELVFTTRRSARQDDDSDASGPTGGRNAGYRSVVGSPITVEGRLWGFISVASSAVEPLPADTEARLASFTDLVAMAIANTESRSGLARLAAEQAALRRVAVLVAEGAPPAVVFDAVAGETLTLMRADSARVCRYEPDGTATVLAEQNTGAEPPTVGTRLTLQGQSVTAQVLRTRQASRRDDLDAAAGTADALAREPGVRCGIGGPIVVEGRLWGVIVAHWSRPGPLPDEAEARLNEFAELVATAIANANSRDQLAASRARLLTEADHARRRVVRDLHDGAQQRLVQTIVILQLTQRAVEPDNEKAKTLIAGALAQAQQANTELRELAHGILPAALTNGGLLSGISLIVSQLDFPVDVDVPSERFAPEIEASAYFVVAEALTNVVKHAHAERAEVRAFVEDETLHLEVRDDGTGGADPRGHGLVGLSDRVMTLNGRIGVEDRAEGGTILAATLPLGAG